MQGGSGSEVGLLGEKGAWPSCIGRAKGVLSVKNEAGRGPFVWCEVREGRG